MKTKGINSIRCRSIFTVVFPAFEYALKFAERVAARVIALHIVQLGEPFTADGYAMYDLSRLIEAARKSAEARMQQFLRLAKSGRSMSIAVSMSDCLLLDLRLCQRA
jgi:hypothetical protein